MVSRSDGSGSVGGEGGVDGAVAVAPGEVGAAVGPGVTLGPLVDGAHGNGAVAVGSVPVGGVPVGGVPVGGGAPVGPSPVGATEFEPLGETSNDVTELDVDGSVPSAAGSPQLVTKTKSDASAVRASAVRASAVGASAVGASAVGASAVGASAVGASAVGASAVGVRQVAVCSGALIRVFMSDVQSSV
jgi:hypothetical protein